MKTGDNREIGGLKNGLAELPPNGQCTNKGTILVEDPLHMKTIPKIEPEPKQPIEILSVSSRDANYEIIMNANVDEEALNNSKDVLSLKKPIRKHKNKHDEQGNKKIFPCPVCKTEFSRPDKMKLHKKEKHDKEANAMETSKTKVKVGSRKKISGHSDKDDKSCGSISLCDTQGENSSVNIENQPSVNIENQKPIWISQNSYTTVLPEGGPTMPQQVNTLPNVITPASTSQLQYTTLSNVTFLPNAMPNYQIIPNSINQPQTTIKLEPNKMDISPYNITNTMPSYTINQIQTQNGTQFVLSTSPIITSHQQNITNTTLLKNYILENFPATIVKLEPQINQNYVVITSDQL
ncbi:uncharacterized protein LOC142238330 [Haematobia irritans]|uniref:uncharacterized protein LOC142238330 n=1 Tax=Haematobia irritans TaxID=7368 RepID=UPI003F4F6C98